jgi:hypothetical protein
MVGGCVVSSGKPSCGETMPTGARASKPRALVVRRHHFLVRISHWLTIPLLLGLTLSGISIYWASPIYQHDPNPTTGSFDYFADAGIWICAHIPWLHHYADPAHIESSVNLDANGNPDPYFVSIDLLTAQHAQTLLATHLNGKTLTLEHGAPLRLLVPVKLGLKNIKAITRITYTKDEPPDYWAKRGYSIYDGI